MGNLCGLRRLSDSFLKYRVKYEMTNLLYKCIVDCVTDTTLFNTVHDVNAKRLQNFKNQMAVVKSVSDEWSHLVQLCIESNQPDHVTINRILSLMPNSVNTLKISHVLCLCTYILDICVKKISTKKPINVCKVIETLVEYLVERNIDVCVQFLDYIDAL